MTIKGNNLKVLQVRQILSNSLLLDDTKLSFIRAVIVNDYGKLTKAQAGRINGVNHSQATRYSVKTKFDALDQRLLRRGLLRYKLIGATKRNDGMFTHRKLFATVRGDKALAAFKATSA